jgi:pre-rRNA-processing protein TSR2
MLKYFLYTAVQHEWGGSESIAKAEDLRSNIFTYFDGSSPNPKMTQEELEDNLISYMEEEFGVVLEDNSEREIADLICRMYHQCGRGECVLVREVVEKAMKWQEQLNQQNQKSVIQSGDTEMDESSDEEVEEGGDDEMATEEQHQKLQTNNCVSQNNPASLEEYVSSNLFGGALKLPKKELPPPRQLGEAEPEKPQPDLDNDGFATVVRKGKNKR